MTVPPPMPPPARPHWFRRNLLWFIPTVVVVLVATGAAIVGAILMMVTGMIRSSEPYQAAFLSASVHPEVTAALGTPIEPGWFVTGNVNFSGSSGHADFAIPISGPDGKGTVYVTGRKSAGVWNYSVLQATIEGKPSPILLEPAPSLP